MKKNATQPVRKRTEGNGNGDKHARLLEYLALVGKDQFTGYIKINYSQGNIGRIEKFEEILKS
ncbi:MAG: hypothetical protein AB1568_05085 [Thermodesulfobacteriota bacterium]